jgi:hypothetical protein
VKRQTERSEVYINQNPDLACRLTGLALDEIETIVGRFAKHSCRAGLLRGKVVVRVDGVVEVRKCFGNKLLWRREEYELC